MLTQQTSFLLEDNALSVHNTRNPWRWALHKTRKSRRAWGSKRKSELRNNRVKVFRNLWVSDDAPYRGNAFLHDPWLPTVSSGHVWVATRMMRGLVSTERSSTHIVLPVNSTVLAAKLVQIGQNSFIHGTYLLRAPKHTINIIFSNDLRGQCVSQSN